MQRFLIAVVGITCAITGTVTGTITGTVTGAAAQGLSPAATTTPPRTSPSPHTAAAAPTGSNRSLPLRPLPAHDRSGGQQGDALGLPAQNVAPFSLLGVAWDDAQAAPPDRVRVRTRSVATGRWSAWRELPTHEGHAPAPDDRPGTRPRRGSTAPLWVGLSDGVQVRVEPPAATGRDRGGATSAAPPAGLTLELVDPGEGAAAGPGTPRAVPRPAAEDGTTVPRPPVVLRSDWGADESLREPDVPYTGTVKAAFLHHTAGTNDYACTDTPAIIRGIYRYHVLTNGWRDIGYNFLVDKCGTVYEGRAGGVAEPVLGAHTLGFNAHTTGIALLGSYDTTAPSPQALEAATQLAAWKLDLSGVDAANTTTLTSSGGTYPEGTSVTFPTISGHRDGYPTDCPGDQLYHQLPTIRREAAALQGR